MAASTSACVASSGRWRCGRREPELAPPSPASCGRSRRWRRRRPPGSCRARGVPPRPSASIRGAIGEHGVGHRPPGIIRASRAPWPTPDPAARRAGAASARSTLRRGCDVRPRRPSVQEVPLAGEDHGDAELVGPGDVLVVLHRAARLHDHRHAGVGGRLDAVGEREERVARAGAALGPAGGLLRGDLAGLDPVLLAGADAPRPGRPSPARCCWTSPPADAPGQRGVGHSASVGARSVTTCQSAAGGHEAVRLLHQPAAADRAQVAGSPARAPAPRAGGCSCAWRCSVLDHAGGVAGGDDHVGLGRGHHRRHGGVVDRPVQGHDAAEGGPRVALERPLVGGRPACRPPRRRTGWRA